MKPRAVQEYVKAFEQSETARQALMPALMAAFDQRTWVQVSSILVRITYGRGFAQVRQPTTGWLPPKTSCAHGVQISGV